MPETACAGRGEDKETNNTICAYISYARVKKQCKSATYFESELSDYCRRKF